MNVRVRAVHFLALSLSLSLSEAVCVCVHASAACARWHAGMRWLSLVRDALLWFKDRIKGSGLKVEGQGPEGKDERLIAIRSSLSRCSGSLNTTLRGCGVLLLYALSPKQYAIYHIFSWHSKKDSCCLCFSDGRSVLPTKRTRKRSRALV